MATLLMYTLTTTLSLMSAKLDAWGQRWVSAIVLMNFRIPYKPGKSNIDADALSRVPWSENLSDEEVQATLKGCLEKLEYLWEVYACSFQIVEDLQLNLEPSKMNPKDWCQA